MDLSFVNLGIEIEKLGRNIEIFGFKIAYYGMIIAIGMLSGLAISLHVAKKEKDNPDDYYDFALWAIVMALLGARVYYVIFSWDDYKNNLLEILNFRAGGLAIYGGVIAAVLTLIVFVKVKKKNFFQMADVGACGLILGQAIGRWGNFFNCEAFGGYTDGLFAMRILRSKVNPGTITEELNAAMQQYHPDIAASYIQVHPTFLYESLWNLAVLAIMLLVRKHRRYRGEMFTIYLLGYGVGRFWIEGLRTDQLLIGSTNLAVSQLLSAVIVVVALGMLIAGHVLPEETLKKYGLLRKEELQHDNVK